MTHIPVELKILDDRVRQWSAPHMMPNYQSTMAAAIDLYACVDAPVVLQPGDTQLISSGISVLMNQEDMAAFLYPRSSTGHKQGLVLGNGTAVIDADYTGPIKISAFNRNPRHVRWWKNKTVTINPGDRIAQMVFSPILRVQLREVENFSAITQRGEGGFGSTGS